MASGSELTYDNSLIEASNRLTLKSGGDTTLSGAQLKAKEVSGNIGGDLKVVTLQDSSKYDSNPRQCWRCTGTYRFFKIRRRKV